MLKGKCDRKYEAKHNSFVPAEGTLSKSSSRAKFSDVAQYRDNVSRAALSYVNAAEKA